MWKWDTVVPAAPPVPQDDSPAYDSLLFGQRIFELNNHLGNVLSTISDKKTGNDSSGIVNYYIAEVLSQNDYYPFGMLMPGREYEKNERYRYGFNVAEFIKKGGKLMLLDGLNRAAEKAVDIARDEIRKGTNPYKTQTRKK